IRDLHRQLDAAEGRWRPSGTALSLAALVALVLGASLVLQSLEEPGERPLAFVGSPAAANRPAEEPPAPSEPGRLAAAVAGCADAACLEAVRGEAIALLESDQPGVRSGAWLHTAPPTWLPGVARLLALVDFELGAREAALRWLELGHEALTATAALGAELSEDEKALRRLLETERARLESWPAPGRIARPVGPDVPALRRFAEDLERALDTPGDGELSALVGAARARGWVRFELQARLEIARRAEDADLARELSEDALERGAVHLADAARALGATAQETDRR
ncbi:MAG: hypothetical protein AAFX50_21070, partial [Acidobacteriota bacterium]